MFLQNVDLGFGVVEERVLGIAIGGFLKLDDLLWVLSMNLAAKEIVHKVRLILCNTLQICAGLRYLTKMALLRLLEFG